MLGLLATLMFLLALSLALAVMTTTLQGSWAAIAAALTMDAAVTGARRGHVVRVSRSFRPVARARFSPRVLSAAA